MDKKLSVYEQIKHPMWQKKRLEILEKKGWKCSMCGETDETLHVHHKRYLKGRMYWEYEDQDLQVLCSLCHESVHQFKDIIKSAIDGFDESFLETVASLLVGFGGDDVSDEIRQIPLNPEADMAGHIGRILYKKYNKNIYELLDIKDFLENDPKEILSYIRAFQPVKEG